MQRTKNSQVRCEEEQTRGPCTTCYRLNVCAPRKFTCWNLNPQCEGTKRWGLWEGLDHGHGHLLLPRCPSCLMPKRAGWRWTGTVTMAQPWQLPHSNAPVSLTVHQGPAATAGEQAAVSCLGRWGVPRRPSPNEAIPLGRVATLGYELVPSAPMQECRRGVELCANQRIRSEQILHLDSSHVLVVFALCKSLVKLRYTAGPFFFSTSFLEPDPRSEVLIAPTQGDLAFRNNNENSSSCIASAPGQALF